MDASDRITRDEPTSPDPAPAKHEGDPLTDPAHPGGSRQGVSPRDVPEGAPAGVAPDEEAAAAIAEEATGGSGVVPADGAPGADDRAAEYLALAQRTQADFENFRKRAAREMRAAETRGVAKTARELLPALDTLALALDQLEGPVQEGVAAVQREILAAFERLGIEVYAPEGEPFDPQVHEAVSQIEVEGVESGRVAHVMQHGYKHGEAVLRPARVVVAA